MRIGWQLCGGAPAKELAAARKHFQGSKEASIPRAVLHWLDGQLRFESGDSRRRSYWRDFMIAARDDFIGLKKYHEATAVVADISLTYLKDRKRLPLFLNRTVELMGNADAAVRDQLEEIRTKANAEVSFRFYRDLEAAILGLRQLVAHRPGVIPRLISSPLDS